MIHNWVILTALGLLTLTNLSCGNGGASSVKGQRNATLTFYGKAIDQDGKPLSGVQFEFRVEAYPKDWTFESRGRDNDAWTVKAVSDSHGLFQFQMTACKIVRLTAEAQGYRHLDDQETDSRGMDNRFYRVISWSDLCYKTAPDLPAVYVFVKDGVREVSALPSRGGYDSGNGIKWTLNAPRRPTKPSLSDVVYKSPSTQPVLER